MIIVSYDAVRRATNFICNEDALSFNDTYIFKPEETNLINQILEGYDERKYRITGKDHLFHELFAMITNSTAARHYPIGTSRPDFIHPTHDPLAQAKALVENNRPEPETRKCTCPREVWMHQGCQCGGV